VNFISSNSLRCTLAALIFTFAVTADVLVKAVVDDHGHDANNPIIWIEHKCAGHFGQTVQDHALPQVFMTAVLTVYSQSFHDIQPVSHLTVLPETIRTESLGARTTNLRC
jgi:hypothetical protein